MSNRYCDIRNKLPLGWHTAKEFGISAATARAMFNQGLLLKMDTKPIHYAVAEDAEVYKKIISFLEGENLPDAASMNLIFDSKDIITFKKVDDEWLEVYTGKPLQPAFCKGVNCLNIYIRGQFILWYTIDDDRLFKYVKGEGYENCTK